MWVTGPGGEPWEVYTVTGDARPDLEGKTELELSAVAGDGTCCTPDGSETDARVARLLLTEHLVPGRPTGRASAQRQEEALPRRDPDARALGQVVQGRDVTHGVLGAWLEER